MTTEPRKSIATEVSAGTVEVTPVGHGYYFVQIGRARYVKRFNLSIAEATELIACLAEVLQAAGHATRDGSAADTEPAAASPPGPRSPRTTQPPR